MTEAERAFLIDLREVTRKHGLRIDGCGCCKSPFIAEADVSDAGVGYAIVDGSVCWVSPSDTYEWAMYRESVALPDGAT